MTPEVSFVVVVARASAEESSVASEITAFEQDANIMMHTDATINAFHFFMSFLLMKSSQKNHCSVVNVKVAADAETARITILKIR